MLGPNSWAKTCRVVGLLDRDDNTWQCLEDIDMLCERDHFTYLETSDRNNGRYIHRNMFTVQPGMCDHLVLNVISLETIGTRTRLVTKGITTRSKKLLVASLLRVAMPLLLL